MELNRSLIWLLLLLSGCTLQPRPLTIDTRYNVRPAKVRLLFDLAHAHPQSPGVGLDKDNYGYYETSNWKSLLKSLGILGVSSDLLVEGKLTTSLLNDYDLFCLYFPEVPAPALTVQEMDALEEWVRGGGGLFIVGEHTNAGRSSERLNPLLKRFGMELAYGSVTDYENTFAFAGWDKYFHFTEHFITRGVRAVGLKTSCAIEIDDSHPDRPLGLVVSSPSSFLDNWNPESPESGFTGDFIQQANEPKGRFVTMAAATPGKGRLVVIGDHNAFGNTAIGYVDNLKLALQAWNWLAGEKLDTLARGRDKTILIPETTRPSDVMTPHSFEIGHGTEAFYTLFTALNRHPETVVHCTEFLEGRYSVVMVTPQKSRFARPYLQFLRNQHKNGATIMVMVDPGSMGEGTRQVMEEFKISLGPLPKHRRKEKGQLMVKGQAMGNCTIEAYPWQAEESETIMKLVTRQGAYPIMVQYGPGIQVVLQAQMFRNQAFRAESGYRLGHGPAQPGRDGMTVFRALWAWLDDF